MVSKGSMKITCLITPM